MLNGDYEVSIGHDTAIVCKYALIAYMKTEQYNSLPADDKSFHAAAFTDIDKAADAKWPGT